MAPGTAAFHSAWRNTGRRRYNPAGNLPWAKSCFRRKPSLISVGMRSQDYTRKPGSGGKILIVDMDVTPGQVIAATIGAGGLPGQAGGATTFGAYSSDDGAAVDVGYLDVMQNTRYGYPGQPGVKGGKGKRGRKETTHGHK